MLQEQPQVLIVTAAVGLLVYLHLASMQFSVNDDIGRTDQLAYIHFAKVAYETDFTYTGQRNRMPLFPWVQALLYRPDMEDEEFFRQGKLVNVAISLVSIALLGAAFSARFARSYAIYALLVIGGLLYALKAPFFQAEILFYTIFAFGFMLAEESIRRPKWYKTVGVGVLFALAHFTKAASLVALAVYACSFIVPLLWSVGKRAADRRALASITAAALAPILIFIALLFPYLNESRARYGLHFYNVNSTFYAWYDSWDEAKQGTRAHGDRKGWPDMPDADIPSLSKYLTEHSLGDIVERLLSGAASFWSRVGHYRHHFYLAAAALALFAGFALWRRGWRECSPASLQSVVFCVAFFAAYALGGLWFLPIAQGERVLLSLFVPMFWTIGLALCAFDKHLQAPAIKGHDIKRWDVLFGFLYVVAFMQIVEMATYGAHSFYAGR